MKAAEVRIRIQREKTRKLYLVSFFLIVLPALIFLPLVLLHDTKIQPEKPLTPPATPVAPESSPPKPIEYRETLRPRTTVGEVLSNYGFSPPESKHFMTK